MWGVPCPYKEHNSLAKVRGFGLEPVRAAFKRNLKWTLGGILKTGKIVLGQVGAPGHCEEAGEQVQASRCCWSREVRETMRDRAGGGREDVMPRQRDKLSWVLAWPVTQIRLIGYHVDTVTALLGQRSDH